MSKNFIIGIDGGKSTGVAVFNSKEQKLVFVKTLHFWAAFNYVVDTFDPGEALVVVEKLNSNGALYARTQTSTRGRARPIRRQRRQRSARNRFVNRGLEAKRFRARRTSTDSSGKMDARRLDPGDGLDGADERARSRRRSPYISLGQVTT